jgi:hypothetical protein
MTCDACDGVAKRSNLHTWKHSHVLYFDKVRPNRKIVITILDVFFFYL